MFTETQTQTQTMYNLPIVGCSSRTAYAHVTVTTVTVNVVIQLADLLCKTTHQEIKDYQEPKELCTALYALCNDPARDFIPAIHWMYKLLSCGCVDSLKMEGISPVGDESDSEFLFRIFKNSPQLFLNSIKKMENEERSKGRPYFMFSLKPGVRLPVDIRFLEDLDDIRQRFQKRFHAVGYGTYVTLSEFISEDMIGLSVERGGVKTNAPKIDILDKVRPVTQRDVRDDLVFYHVPSRSILVSTRYPTDVIFYVDELQKLLFGSSEMFVQTTFSTSFVKDVNLAENLKSASLGLAEGLSIRHADFKKDGQQPKVEKFKTLRARKECLSHPSYADFHDARQRFPKPQFIKIQIELIGEKRFYDSIDIQESRVDFGKHISEEVTLAILYKLNIITRVSDA